MDANFGWKHIPSYTIASYINWNLSFGDKVAYLFRKKPNSVYFWTQSAFHHEANRLLYHWAMKFCRQKKTFASYSSNSCPPISGFSIVHIAQLLISSTGFSKIRTRSRIEEKNNIFFFEATVKFYFLLNYLKKQEIILC